MNYFYEKNTELLESPINVTFEEILAMSKQEFLSWVIELRKTVVDIWDNKGIPPRVGYNKDEIIDQFRKMESAPVNEFWTIDDLTGEKDVIRNTLILGNAVNQFFPTMMKTRINYSKNDDGKSIYDFFAKEELLDTFVTYATRHFKRDSFYHYSNPVKFGLHEEYVESIPITDSNPLWFIEQFELRYRKRGEYDYWLAPVKEDKEYTGYNQELKGVKYITLNKEQIESLWELIPERSKSNVDFDKSEIYQIRYYKLGQKLFPIGLKAFRVSFCQYATNFPPLTAKLIYETFTEQYKNEETIYVWDPSSGWGGRLLGAMSVSDDRHITYLGNDPNTDHNTSENRTKYHEIYDFYKKSVSKGGLWSADHTDFKFWQLGSEVMQFDPEFQKYKGKISLVFTSPPYFAKEAYSEDPEQSYKKYSNYDIWRDGFLYETLKTAYDWLRPGGYICWNIADAKFGPDMLPLEKDSLNIMEKLGFKYIKTLKMSLAQMPGSGRINSDGSPTAKNFYKTGNLWLKYEPIFILKKN